MPANSYGIIVEGGYDSAVYEAIIRKLASHEVQIAARPCEGKPNLLRKFPAFLEAFKYDLAGAPVDMALIIVDSDGQAPAELETKMRSRVAARQYPFEVHFHAVQHSMEAWLLADVQALSRVIQVRAGKTLNRTHDAPQDLLDAKPVLRRLLEEKSIAYTSAVAVEIAEQINPEVLFEKCPRFRIFAELVDC